MRYKNKYNTNIETFLNYSYPLQKVFEKKQYIFDVIYSLLIVYEKC